MTDEEIKTALLTLFGEYCDRDFVGGDPTPAPITLAVEKGLEITKNTKFGVSAESINGDISITYGKNTILNNELISSLLKPYMRLSWY